MLTGKVSSIIPQALDYSARFDYYSSSNLSSPEYNITSPESSSSTFSDCEFELDYSPLPFLSQQKYTISNLVNPLFYIPNQDYQPQLHQPPAANNYLASPFQFKFDSPQIYFNDFSEPLLFHSNNYVTTTTTAAVMMTTTEAQQKLNAAEYQLQLQFQNSEASYSSLRTEPTAQPPLPLPVIHQGQQQQHAFFLGQPTSASSRLPAFRSTSSSSSGITPVLTSAGSSSTSTVPIYANNNPASFDTPGGTYFFIPNPSLSPATNSLPAPPLPRNPTITGLTATAQHRPQTSTSSRSNVDDEDFLFAGDEEDDDEDEDLKPFVSQFKPLKKKSGEGKLMKSSIGGKPKAQVKGGAARKDDHSSKTFVCPHEGCGRKFARNFNCQSHVKSHLGIRDFTCDHCEKTFSRRHDRARHVTAVHSAVAPVAPVATVPEPVPTPESPVAVSRSSSSFMDDEEVKPDAAPGLPPRYTLPPVQFDHLVAFGSGSGSKGNSFKG